MRMRLIVTAATIFVFIGVAMGGLLLSGVLTTEGVHNPQLLLDMKPSKAESGGQCGLPSPVNNTDDDGDGLVNDGCPASGAPETGTQCSNNTDDDADGLVNDGCPAVGPETDNGVTAGGFGGNVMNIGAIENCQRVDSPGFGLAGRASGDIDLIVQNVENMAGAQVRINYTGTNINAPGDVNPAPFVSVINAQAIGFVNLPFDATVVSAHRGTTKAVTSDNTAGTTLLFAGYTGDQSKSITADTPYINDEVTGNTGGIQTYDAPNGGVVMRFNFSLRSPSSGNPAVRLHLDDQTAPV